MKALRRSTRHDDADVWRKVRSQSVGDRRRVDVTQHPRAQHLHARAHAFIGSSRDDGVSRQLRIGERAEDFGLNRANALLRLIAVKRAPDGTVTVTFHANGKKVPITVDADLPALDLPLVDRANVFGGSTTPGELWPALVEKAYTAPSMRLVITGNPSTKRLSRAESKLSLRSVIVSSTIPLP